MKHLWNGVAVAAALAFAMPVSAQTTASAPPSPSAASAAAPSARAQPSTSATAPRPRRVRHVAQPIHSKARLSRAATISGNIANQLNARELQRIRSGGSAQATTGSPHATEGFGSSSPPAALFSPVAPSRYQYNPYRINPNYSPYGHEPDTSLKGGQ